MVMRKFITDNVTVNSAIVLCQDILPVFISVLNFSYITTAAV